MARRSTFLINAFAVKDARGQVLQYRGLMLDVTGLRAYQSELQRERDFSGKILNNTQSLILVADTAGLISYANRRWKVLGYEQQGILGRPLDTVVAASKQAAFKQAYFAVLAWQSGGQPGVAGFARGRPRRTILGEPQPHAG